MSNKLQWEFTNDRGATVIMTLLPRGDSSELIIEHEDFDGEGGPVHEEFGTEVELEKSRGRWIADLKGLQFSQVV